MKPLEQKLLRVRGTFVKLSKKHGLVHSLEGRRFGNWIVISYHGTRLTRGGNKKGGATWLCRCDCGNQKIVFGYSLTKGLSKSCGCSWSRNSGSKNANWSGYRGLSGSVWNRIKNGTRTRSLEFKITKKYCWELFLSQDKRCALTNLPIDLAMHSTASLDRINSSIGYIKGNVQWVHKDINRMKNSFDQDYFIKMCHLIVDNSLLLT